MGETISFPGIPDWMAREVAEYDLALTFTPATVLDIGANIGAFTLLAAQRWPAARITAVEPVAANAAGFRANVGRFPNVTLLDAAVRVFNGPAKIYLGDRGVTCGFHDLGRQTRETETVRCIDANSLASAEFVKIDTEGCEVEILGRLNLTDTKVLCVEYHFAEDVDTLKFIAELNDLPLHSHQPKGDTWGVMIFARPGAIAEAQTQKLKNPDSVSAISEFRLPKVFIALPVYGGLDVFFTQSLIKVLNDAPCELMLRMNPGDSLVSRSRNTLTADFLESDATHLLFIDSDLIFSGEQIARIVTHDEDIVGGFYPKKQEGPVQWVCNGHLVPNEPRADGLQEVRYMGTGFLCVKRCVFDRMIELYPELSFKADHRDRIEHDFWTVGVYRSAECGVRSAESPGRYLSEDWYFCQRALDAGFKVYGDTRIVLKHVGQAIYPLKSQETELFSGVTAGNGTPGADAIRPSSAPAPSRAEAGPGHCAPRETSPVTRHPSPVTT